MTAFKLAKQIVKSGFTYVGVRRCCADEVAVVGATLRNSYDWDFESDVSTYFTTGQQLNGVCALSVDNGDMEDYMMDEDYEAIASLIESAVTASELYGANEGPVVLIAGLNATYGTDESEIVIREARVLHVF